VAVLDRHAGVKSSQVVAREDGCRAKRLVAYVILNQRSPLQQIELRNFVANETPAAYDSG